MCFSCQRQNNKPKKPQYGKQKTSADSIEITRKKSVERVTEQESSGVNHSAENISKQTKYTKTGSTRQSSRSRYSRAEQHAPARPSTIVVSPMPRRSMFRDAAAVAGGVTVGTTMGHLAGEAISGLFGGGRRHQEVVEALPRDYRVGSEPSGPCAFEIAQFLQCATSTTELNECDAFATALKECKRRNSMYFRGYLEIICN